MDADDREDLNHYIRFVRLGRDDIDAANVAWSIIEPQMPALIEQFYDHLFAIGLQHNFQGKNLAVIKQKQMDYWDILFSGNVGAAYQAHVNYISEKHRLTDVELTDYIGSYAWFSQRFFEIIATSAPPPEFRRAQLLAAINKAIYLDMMIATGASNVHLLDI